MSDDADHLLRVETVVDRETIARRHHRRARRPPRRSDRWWALGVGALCILGLVVIGSSWLWWVGLAAAVLFLAGELAERRAQGRELAAIPPAERQRVFEIRPASVTVTTADGTLLVAAAWSEVDEVRRVGGVYTIVIHDDLYELPATAFPTELARGSFEALAARNDRPIHHG